MSKRIWSFFSSTPPAIAAGGNTSAGDRQEDEYNHQSKRQRREYDCPSDSYEHSSPRSVLQLAGVRRRRDPRSLTTAHRNHGFRNVQERQRRNQNCRPTFSHRRNQKRHAGYEAEVDDESSSDEESNQYGRYNSRMKQSPKSLSSRNGNDCTRTTGANAISPLQDGESSIDSDEDSSSGSGSESDEIIVWDNAGAQQPQLLNRNCGPTIFHRRDQNRRANYAEEDDESSSDEERYQYGRDNSRRKQSPKSLSSRHGRQAEKVVGVRKKHDGDCYQRQRSHRERRHKFVIDRSTRSESDLDSSSEDSRACARLPLKSPKMSTAWSHKAIGTTVEVQESERLRRKCARMGTVTGWRDEDTAWVTSSNKVRNAIRLTKLKLLPQSELPPNRKSDILDAKPRARSHQPQSTSRQKDQMGASLEIESNATDTRALQNSDKQLRDTAPKTSPVARSNVTKKPPPKSRQQKQVRFPPLPAVNDDGTKCVRAASSDRDSSCGNKDCTKLVKERSLFQDSDSDSDSNGELDDIRVLEYSECVVFDVENTNPVAVAELRRKSLAVATITEDDVQASNTQVLADDSVNATSGHFTVGQRIRVRKGYNKSNIRGKSGIIIGHGANSVSFKVQLENGKERAFHCSSLEFLDGSTPKQSVESKQQRPNSKSTKSTKPRKQGAGNTKSRPRKKKSDMPVAQSAAELEWVVRQDVVPRDRFWGLKNAKIILPDDEKDDLCFFKHILRNQRLTLEVPLKNKKVDEGNSVDEVRRELSGNSGDYEMISAKLFEDDKGAHMFAKKTKYARVMYAAVDDLFSITNELLRIADFTTLNPRKIAARLELLQSPTNLKITHHDDAMFQEIPDHGYVGGGFIHEDTLVDLLVKAGMGYAAASRAAAIQVRIFMPSRGIFKGMLVKKRTINGPPIELPWSMKKVPRSTHPNRLKGAHILICRHKVHPTTGNEMIGKKLDPEKKDPSDKSFKPKIAKELSIVLFRLWETLGVPADLCERYKTQSVLPNRRNHAWLVGVPDPTGALPPDTIFVPGMKKQESYDIFVTRFPCYARDHGRKFRAITQKPHRMSDADWEWLNNDFSFGVIIFSNPRPGKLSIPERIANGDLDGDLFLVCWDKEVVDSIKATPLVDEPAEDDGKLSTVPSDSNWFRKSQDVNVAKVKSEISHLIGSLYKLAEKKADNSSEKLDDPDVSALFDAYNEALEYQKHGRKICLPRHLIKELKKELRDLDCIQPI
ncbi:MAG: hypothetical protein SGBAC_005577 [Bacillariaceae sp.]